MTLQWFQRPGLVRESTAIVVSRAKAAQSLAVNCHMTQLPSKSHNLSVEMPAARKTLPVVISLADLSNRHLVEGTRYQVTSIEDVPTQSWEAMLDWFTRNPWRSFCTPESHAVLYVSPHRIAVCDRADWSTTISFLPNMMTQKSGTA